MRTQTKDIRKIKTSKRELSASSLTAFRRAINIHVISSPVSIGANNRRIAFIRRHPLAIDRAHRITRTARFCKYEKIHGIHVMTTTYLVPTTYMQSKRNDEQDDENSTPIYHCRVSQRRITDTLYYTHRYQFQKRWKDFFKVTRWKPFGYYEACPYEQRPGRSLFHWNPGPSSAASSHVAAALSRSMRRSLSPSFPPVPLTFYRLDLTHRPAVNPVYCDGSLSLSHSETN